MSTQRLPVAVTCVRCMTQIVGALIFDVLTVVDSTGFGLFEEGAVCDRCLKDGQEPML